MSASYTKSAVHLDIPGITSSPYVRIELAQSNIHCYHAGIMAWDWKSRIKWCYSCTAPAKWKQLPYFCLGLQLSCRLGAVHLMNTPQRFAINPAVPWTPVLVLVALLTDLQTAMWHRLFCQARVFFNNMTDHTCSLSNRLTSVLASPAG